MISTVMTLVLIVALIAVLGFIGFSLRSRYLKHNKRRSGGRD